MCLCVYRVPTKADGVARRRARGLISGVAATPEAVPGRILKLTAVQHPQSNRCDCSCLVCAMEAASRRCVDLQEAGDRSRSVLGAPLRYRMASQQLDLPVHATSELPEELHAAVRTPLTIRLTPHFVLCVQQPYVVMVRDHALGHDWPLYLGARSLGFLPAWASTWLAVRLLGGAFPRAVADPPSRISSGHWQ